MRWTSASVRGRRSRVVPTPRCWRQVARRYPRGDGDNKAGRQGEHAISRKPLRREGRTASAEPVCSCAFFYLPLHMRPRVQRAPGLPCALSLLGANENYKPRAQCVARVRIHVSSSLRTRRSVRGKNSRVATSACSDCVRSLCWHSRLKTSNLSHLNHLSPFPGHSCTMTGRVE